MAGIKGDFDELQRLQRLVGEMADGKLYREVVQGVAQEAQTLIGDSFQEEQSPYGAKWKRSYRATVEGGQTLRDTSRLRNSVTSSVKPTSDGFLAGTNVLYAAVHQYGAVIRPKNAKALRFQLPGGLGKRGRRKGGAFVTAQKVTIPQRQFMPEPTAGGIPPKWGEAFDEVADAVLRDHLEQ